MSPIVRAAIDLAKEFNLIAATSEFDPKTAGCRTGRDHRGRKRPNQPWRWAFDLAKRLRAYHGGDPRSLRPAVKAFYTALEHREEQWDSADACFEEFLSKWHTVRVPEGQDMLDVAVAEARAHPLSTDAGIGELFDQVASVAFYLQKAQRDAPIVLPGHRLAAVLLGSANEKNRRRIYRIIDLLLQEKFLRVVDKDHRYTEGKARTFRFVSGAPQ